MELFVLVATLNGNLIVTDKCLASSMQEAYSKFNEEWQIEEAMKRFELTALECMSEADYLHETWNRVRLHDANASITDCCIGNEDID